MDEVWSVELAARADRWEAVFTELRWANNQPLNTLWLRGVPQDAPEWRFRLVSLVLGTLSIPLAGWVMLRWGGGWTAAWAAAAASALSFFQIQYATEARGYAGAWFCALLALGIRGGGGTEAAPGQGRPGGVPGRFAFWTAQIAGMLWHPGHLLSVAASGHDAV